MFFCLRFSLSRSAMEDIERKTGGEKEMDRNRWCGRCMCVCGCWSLPIFMLIGWNGVQMEPGIGKETVEAVLQMRIWQVVEVILHCLLAAILKISTSHATSNNCFVEHIGPHSRELGACGGWKGGVVWGYVQEIEKMRMELREWGGSSDIEGSATPIFYHGGCGGGTVPCCTSLITTTITHTHTHKIMNAHTLILHLFYFLRMH